MNVRLPALHVLQVFRNIVLPNMLEIRMGKLIIHCLNCYLYVLGMLFGEKYLKHEDVCIRKFALGQVTLVS